MQLTILFFLSFFPPLLRTLNCARVTSGERGMQHARRTNGLTARQTVVTLRVLGERLAVGRVDLPHCGA